MRHRSRNLLRREEARANKGLQQDPTHLACTKHRYPQAGGDILL
jgi:hypothetical protein